MRDVVEGAPHALDERADAIEHRVEEGAQLVDGVAVGAHRHARFGVAGAGDPADRANQPVNRLEHAPRDQHPARQPDEDDRHRDERDDRAEPRQQFLAALGALADLEQRAVEEPRRGDFEPCRARARLRLLPQATAPAEPADVEVVPLGRHADEERLGAAADDAHEEPFVPAGPLLDVDRARERRQPAAA